MNDIAQVNLAEPQQLDWNNYDSGGSKYQAPPPAADAAGNAVVYYGVAQAATEKVSDYAVDADGNPLLNFSLDPIVINTGEHKGYIIRFTDASVKLFEKNGKPTNASKLGNFLRACGLTAKPQTNDEYRAAVRAALPKTFGFTVDWTAKNKDTQEQVKGYAAFPDDPERPGQKKAILKAGDFYNVLDSKGKPTGQQAQVKSEVLFANAKLRFFRDPSRGR